MPSVCLCFQLHLPVQLDSYTFFDIGKKHSYVDEAAQKDLLQQAASQCYLPTNQLLLEMIAQHEGKFKISFAVSGILLENWEKYTPEVIDSFLELHKTGCVEWISTPYAHSLSFGYDRKEFRRQLELQGKLLEKYFDVTPEVLLNTELIYHNQLAYLSSVLGFKGVFAPNLPHLVNGQSPHQLYTLRDARKIVIFLQDKYLSDCLGERFDSSYHDQSNLYADVYASWYHQMTDIVSVVPLVVQYENFGMRQDPASGIMDFLYYFPQELLRSNKWDFETPGGIIEKQNAHATYDSPQFISKYEDFSAWTARASQREMLEQIYHLRDQVFELGNEKLLKDWTLLQAAENFFVKSNGGANGVEWVHRYTEMGNRIADLQLRLRDTIITKEEEI